MNKGSMIFKIICLALSLVFCLASLPAFAEEAAGIDETVEAEVPVKEETVEEAEAQEPTAVDVEEPTTVDTDEPVEEETGTVEEPEILDLYAATLRDNGIYVTPTADNIAAFTYNGVRYKVNAGEANSIVVGGFEDDPEFDSADIEDNVADRLQAKGSVAVEAAHSGYFGLSVTGGKVVYRANVTAGSAYVFSEWVKMPENGSISDNGRAFKLKAESGSEYTVGYNEIGRDIDATGTWQQVIFTFRAPETGLFEMNFEYRGRNPLYLDDMEMYKVSVFNNPISIKSVEVTDAEGNAVDRKAGLTKSGQVTHKTTLYNSDEDDVYYTAVLALYKNDIMVDCVIETGNMVLVLDEAVNTLTVNIPEDEDLSQYKYMVYFINDADPTVYYGTIDENNPYILPDPYDTEEE